jgi:hypothetical protein
LESIGTHAEPAVIDVDRGNSLILAEEEFKETAALLLSKKRFDLPEES